MPLTTIDENLDKTIKIIENILKSHEKSSKNNIFKEYLKTNKFKITIEVFDKSEDYPNETDMHIIDNLKDFTPFYI